MAEGKKTVSVELTAANIEEMAGAFEWKGDLWDKLQAARVELKQSRHADLLLPWSQRIDSYYTNTTATSALGSINCSNSAQARLVSFAPKMAAMLEEISETVAASKWLNVPAMRALLRKSGWIE